MTTENGCPTFPHFGASYPDACCIDGYLWDLDKCNDDGTLYGGGDDPCPFCNTDAFVENVMDGEEENYDEQKVRDYVDQLRERYGS